MADIKLKTLVKENVVKNVLIVVCTVLVFPMFESTLSAVPLEAFGDVLMVVSIFLVTVSFANFAFTYETINKNSAGARFLGFAATFLFMLLTALLLEVMVISIGLVHEGLYTMSLVFSVLLYLSIVLYDFWDLLRFK